MSKKYYLEYWRRDEPTLNFGEAMIAPLLAGLGIEHDPASDEVLFTLGSEFCEENINTTLASSSRIVVCGYGWSHSTPPSIEFQRRYLEIYALRGPVTSRALGRLDVPLGDPGFLLPEVLSLRCAPHHGKIIYAPHWHNRSREAWAECEMFNVEVRQEDFIGRAAYLKGSRFVLTNSMHVAIFCLAYGIPFAPALRPGEHCDKPRKWEDVFEWLGIPLVWHTDFQTASIWYSDVGSAKLPDLTPLLKAFERIAR